MIVINGTKCGWWKQWPLCPCLSSASKRATKLNLKCNYRDAITVDSENGTVELEDIINSII